MALKTLAEYLDTLPPLPKPDASGVACPNCEKELTWDRPHLISVDPPMRRLICTDVEGCRSFSEVVLVNKG